MTAALVVRRHNAELMADAPTHTLRRLARQTSQQTTELLVGWRLRASVVPDFVVACVYRRANSAVVRGLVEGLADVRLWALDEPTPELARFTEGAGPGKRTELLNSLLKQSRAPYTVIIDDDIVFRTGSIERVVVTAQRHQLDLCQPAQAPYGHVFHNITIQRRFSALRLTNFVEIGPLVVVGPRLRDRILPFPSDFGMGWGLDVRWSALCKTHGARFGIVDSSVVEHLSRIGAAYDHGPERKRLDTELRKQGVESLADLPRTKQVIRPWRA